MNILLSAFSCGPNYGSEAGVGWNWAIEAAKSGHTVTVLTEPQFRAEIEAAATAGQLPRGLTFDYFSPRWLSRIRDLGDKTRMHNLTWQIVHLLWQMAIVPHIRQHHSLENYDIVHHVTFGGIRHPTLLYRLPLPLVLGPLGGGETSPRSLRRSFAWGEWIEENLRDVHTALLHYDPMTRGACSRALAVYVKTPQSRDALPLADKGKVKTRLEIGVHKLTDRPPRGLTTGAPLRVLYAGRMIAIKGMHLGLQAVAQTLRHGTKISLTMVGNGYATDSWKALASELHIDDVVTWRGRIPFQDMSAAYVAHDVLLFPSLRDSSGNVVLEALSHGLPVVCLDLGGPAEIVDESCGRVIPTAGTGEAECAMRLANALQELARSGDLLQSLSKGAHAKASQFLWSDVVAGLYRDVEKMLTCRPGSLSTDKALMTPSGPSYQAAE